MNYIRKFSSLSSKFDLFKIEMAPGYVLFKPWRYID